MHWADWKRIPPAQGGSGRQKVCTEPAGDDSRWWSTLVVKTATAGTGSRAGERVSATASTRANFVVKHGCRERRWSAEENGSDCAKLTRSRTERTTSAGVNGRETDSIRITVPRRPAISARRARRGWAATGTRSPVPVSSSPTLAAQRIRGPICLAGSRSGEGRIERCTAIVSHET